MSAVREIVVLCDVRRTGVRRRAHPNSTAKRPSGTSCVRIGCQIGSSNPSTIFIDHYCYAWNTLIGI